MSALLKDIIVLEFCQYLSGPSAGLRLADFGARVIKVERPGTGDAARKLAIKDLWINDTSLLFHTINRDKESFTADLKNKEELEIIKKLIATADVLIHNFRPGVMEKNGLDYKSVEEINPRIIYAEITGYGNEAEWKYKPGQDLLAQSISGLTYTTGNKQDAPRPFGLAMGDYFCGSHAVQGILAALIRRKKTGKGAFLQLSLLESLLDFQFEFFTTYFQTKKQPERSENNNAHSLLSAPYGIYQTADGYLAVAMMPLQKLSSVLECDDLNSFSEDDTFKKRDEIKKILSTVFRTNTTQNWLQKMEAFDLWVMPVLDWNQLRKTQTYQALQMEQEIDIQEGKKIVTTRCPIRINNEKIFSSKAAPGLGEHTIKIKEELLKQKA